MTYDSDPPHAVTANGSLSGLQISAWKRYGHDRLYVNRADGEKIAWYDRKTGEFHLLVENHADAALEALAPYVTGVSTEAAPPVPPKPVGAPPKPSAPPPVPPAASSPYRLDDRNDLAVRQPGEAVRAKRDEVAPGLTGLLVSVLLGRRSEAYSWRMGLAGERKAGAELRRLTAHGWHVLHSIPLPRDVDIDHLLIGPGGVFCLNTKHHRGARVWVGDDSVKIGGQSYPYVRRSRAEARRASSALTRACGFPVDVTPVIVFVGTDSLTVVPSLTDVRIRQLRELAAFKHTSGVWSPPQLAAMYAAARDGRTWVDA